MNRFNIGQRVWCVCFSGLGFKVRKCLVTGIKAYLNDVGDHGIVEKSIYAMDYNLYPISSDIDSGEEYLWLEEEQITSSPKTMFRYKEDAFNFLDESIRELKHELKDED